MKKTFAFLTTAVLASSLCAHAGDKENKGATASCTSGAKAQAVAYGEKHKLSVADAMDRLLNGGACDFAACECQTTPLEEGVACGGLSWSLAMRAAKDKAAFAELAPRLSEAFEANASNREQQARLIDVLAQVPNWSSVELANQLFERSPEAFTDKQRIALAEAGGEAFLISLKKTMAAHWENEEPVDVRVAALFVRKYGKVKPGLSKRLHEIAAAPVDKATSEAHDTLLAAAVLNAAGDRDAWNRTIHEVHSEVLTALDGGDLDRARELALRLDYFKGLASAYGGSTLGYLDERANWHVHEQKVKFATAEEIFQLIEEVART